MEKITTVKVTTNGWIVNGRVSIIDLPGYAPADEVRAWIAGGNAPTLADPDPAPPTPRQQIIDSLKNDPAKRALVLSIAADKGWTKAQTLDWLEANQRDAF